jgi:sugar phosphate isomerase/epimerase
MTINAQLSLAQWSLSRSYLGAGFEGVMEGCLHNPYFGIDLRRSFSRFVCGSLDPLDFPIIAREEFGFDTVEYVNTFYFDRVYDRKYFSELKRRADSVGVRSRLIMCDFEGLLGAVDEKTREEVVRRNVDWLMAAAMLDCEAIRVNVRGEGKPEEQQARIAESVYQIAEQADKLNLNVLIENHSDLSAQDPDWVVGIIEKADHPRIGTLVDFGNWTGDAYIGVEKLMPYAKGVSAKSYDFDGQGMETKLDYPRLFKILDRFNYHGYIGIEYEGERLPEADGIRVTKALVEKMLSAAQALHIK